jgi:crooked neck
MREAHEFREVKTSAPRQRITDREELADYQMGKRRAFEDMLRRNRIHVGTWLNYAAWEQSQDEIPRARSIYERALDVDPRNPTIYLKYLEMEMKHRNINRARNLFDRVVAILPRLDQFWLKYTYMEEMLGNVNGARQIFERWMQWHPDESAWMAYAKMEMRYGEIDRARAVYHRFVQAHPEPKNWLKWIKFEEEHQNIDKVREIFDQALQFLGDEHLNQKLVIAFAKFETRQREYERARAIYKYALERLPKDKSEALYKQYTQFEKQFGDQNDIEQVVFAKRRALYEQVSHRYKIQLFYLLFLANS